MSAFFEMLSDLPVAVEILIGVPLMMITFVVLCIGAIGLPVLVIALLTDWYCYIPPGHRGVIRRGNRLIGVYGSGFRVKRPIWDGVKLVDMRLRTLTVGELKVGTYEKLDVTVGCSLTYEVTDCAEFSANPLEEEAARTLLAEVITAVADRYGIRAFAEQVGIITADLHTTLIERTMDHGVTIGCPDLTVVLPDDPVRTALELRRRGDAIALAASQLEQLPAVTAVRA